MAEEFSIVKPVSERRVGIQLHIGTLTKIAGTLLDAPHPAPDTMERLYRILHDLAVDLRELIALKQTNGYFRELVSMYPASRRSVVKLLGDHQRLVLELDRMRSRLHLEAYAGELRGQLHGWVTRMRDLDAREDALIHKACHMDLSPID